MPLVDMPIKALKEYQGITPCPSDFDEFWDKSLEEMRQIDPQVELIPADFKLILQNASICISPASAEPEYTPS